MTQLPSLPPLPFRTMIGDKKALMEVSKTNFGSLGWKSLLFLVLLTIVAIAAIEFFL